MKMGVTERKKAPRVLVNSDDVLWQQIFLHKLRDVALMWIPHNMLFKIKSGKCVTGSFNIISEMKASKPDQEKKCTFQHTFIKQRENKNNKADTFSRHKQKNIRASRE